MGNVQCMYRECIGYCLERRVVMNSEIIHAERGRGRTMGPDVMCTALYLDLDNISVLQTFKTHSSNSSQI